MYRHEVKCGVMVVKRNPYTGEVAPNQKRRRIIATAEGTFHRYAKLETPEGPSDFICDDELFPADALPSPAK